MAIGPKKCSKCGVNPRVDPEGTNPWCRECQAEYHASRQKGLMDRAYARGFIAGAAAFRQAAEYRLRTFPAAHFSGAEAAVLVGRVAAPRPGQDTESEPSSK